MQRCTDHCNSSSDIYSDNKKSISSLMKNVSNSRIASSASGTNNHASIGATSSLYAIMKYFLEQHNLKQVNSPGTGDCCLYSAALS